MYCYYSVLSDRCLFCLVFLSTRSSFTPASWPVPKGREGTDGARGAERQVEQSFLMLKKSRKSQVVGVGLVVGDVLDCRRSSR